MHPPQPAGIQELHTERIHEQGEVKRLEVHAESMSLRGKRAKSKFSAVLGTLFMPSMAEMFVLLGP